MAKAKREEKKKSKKKAAAAEKQPHANKHKKKEKEDAITLEALDAMSSSDDDDEDIPEALLNTKAKNLRQAISEGKFDHIIEKLKKASNDDDDSGSEMEEIEMSDGSSSDNDDDDDNNKIKSPRKGNKEEKEEESDDDDDDAGDDSGEAVEGQGKKSGPVANEDDNDSESSNDAEEEEEDSSDDEEEEENEEEHNKIRQMENNNQASSKALAIVTTELVKAHARLPWAETFDVVPTTSLPFTTSTRKRKNDDDSSDDEEEIVDIHDDLKREVAFYNNALEAVHEARSRCDKNNVPFSRPEDFFAEMVKTDDHMAKVKDKLIFETKKMDAVAQRKANRENKLRARESQANRLAEKAKKKKDHFKNVEEWANNAANNRGGALRDDLDDMYLNNRSTSKKREAADRKYGFGGKRGRFKQNDRSTLNDVSGFNPRGNFAGGMKKSAKSGGRQGKRARDAKRARRN